MTKYEKINQIISEFLSYFETLGDEERKDCKELSKMICQFKILQNSDGTISINIVHGMITTFRGSFETNEAVFVYALFSGLVELEYQFRAKRRTLNPEVAKEIEKYVCKLSLLIKDIALDENLEQVRDFDSNEFFKELRRVVVDEKNKKIKLLEEHKKNNIEEIRLINRIYDKFHVISSCILFFDSIDGINKQCGKSDSRKLQYTAFVIFKDVYVQTALWLNNKTYWEVRASWQLVEDFEFVINKFFLKTRFLKTR